MKHRDWRLLPLLPYALLPLLAIYVYHTMTTAAAGVVLAVPLLGLLALLALLTLPLRHVAVLTLGLIPVAVPFGFYRGSHDFFFVNSAEVMVYIAMFVLLTSVVLGDHRERLVGPPTAAIVMLVLSLIPLADAGSWTVALSYSSSLFTGFLVMVLVINLSWSTVLRSLEVLAACAVVGALTAIVAQAGKGGALIARYAAIYRPNIKSIAVSGDTSSVTQVARANFNSVHPNGYVVALMLCLALGSIAILLGIRNRLLQAVLLAGYVAVLGTAAVLTLSRTGMVGIVVTGGVALLMLIRSRRTRWLVILGTLVVLTGFIVVPHLNMGERVDTSALQSRYLVSDPASVDTFRFRLDLAAETLVIIGKHPFGIGFGSFGTDVLSLPFKQYTWINHAHNLFLQLAVEGGLAFLAAFLWLCLTVVRRSFGLWRSSSDRQVVGVFAIAGVAGLLVSGLGDADLVGDPLLMVLAWFLFALPFCRSTDDEATEATAER